MAKGDLEAILRHKETLRNVVHSVEEIKVQTKKARLADGQTMEDMPKSGAKLKTRLMKLILKSIGTLFSICCNKHNKERTLCDQEWEEELKCPKDGQTKYYFEKKKKIVKRTSGGSRTFCD